jgi:DNA-binding IclR family transcriptional regulator
VRRRHLPQSESVIGAGNGTADRVIDILQLFTQERPLWSVGQIARHFGMSQSTTYRYVASLRASGLIVEDGERGFHLGPGVFALARVAKSTTLAVRLAAPYLWKLADSFGAKAAIQERVGDDIIHLDLLEGPTAFTFGKVRSQLFPWPTTCAAMTLLAFAPDREREAMMRRMKPLQITGDAPKDHDELARAVTAAQRDGYAVSNEKREGVWGVAAPVYSYGIGRYCIALAMPTARARQPARSAIVSSVQQSASQLTEDLAKTEL